MAVKVAINGFGRIGRLVLRAIIESGRTDVVPVAINDLGSVEANAHLFRYDSVHGRFPGEVEVSGQTITIRHNGRVYGPITVSAEPKKKSSSAMLRSPLAETRRIEASRAIRMGGRSADGTPLTMFPPTVPRLQIWLEAMVWAAMGSERKRSCNSFEL